MYNKVFKRVLDLLFSLVILPILIPLFVIIAILIKVEDNGPVFHKGERIGKDNKVFKMYKFRSMYVNAPDLRNKDGSTYNSKDDPRVTKVGRILRETSLDELPQIFNVLIGDMSIIGPRASLASVLDTYKDDEKDKMLVRPGITGYTQAYYRNSLSVREKRLKDAWYANNVSFTLDLKIFVKTFITLFSRKNLYTNDSTMRNFSEEEREV